mgnify:CR=1 FL=1
MGVDQKNSYDGAAKPVKKLFLGLLLEEKPNDSQGENQDNVLGISANLRRCLVLLEKRNIEYRTMNSEL